MMKQERAARTRQLLIRSAAEAFERHGFTRARLADISSSAGVTTGALHFHFANKAALASTVEATAAAILRCAARSVRHPGANALQLLTGASQALADRLRHDVVARAGFRLSCGDDPHRPGLDLRGEWFECIHRLLTEAEDHHLLAEGVSRQDAIASIAAATTGFEVLGRTDPTWLSPASLSRFWRLVLPLLATAEALATLDLPAGEPLTQARVVEILENQN
ncbi:TetR family transcriptional regulator [Streptomyces canus]|uniref:ScbR family autoregulator-binding transcription factor n=1 Tax=Streptomyces canus TaxID=58343 RepID=UPI002252625E|nr:ScbR family autoregulator-binding transcription factor [Streptomyces canus]MCX4857261.1 ScbR family autoregulator-binding transcription factor [Streptomyces canus]WSW37363.1 TetR family transcriptional regulator [Streptomyces canus]